MSVQFALDSPTKKSARARCRNNNTKWQRLQQQQRGCVCLLHALGVFFNNQNKFTCAHHRVPFGCEREREREILLQHTQSTSKFVRSHDAKRTFPLCEHSKCILKLKPIPNEMKKDVPYANHFAIFPSLEEFSTCMYGRARWAAFQFRTGVRARTWLSSISFTIELAIAKLLVLLFVTVAGIGELIIDQNSIISARGLLLKNVPRFGWDH